MVCIVALGNVSLYAQQAADNSVEEQATVQQPSTEAKLFNYGFGLVSKAAVIGVTAGKKAILPALADTVVTDGVKWGITNACGITQKHHKVLFNWGFGFAKKGILDYWKLDEKNSFSRFVKEYVCLKFLPSFTKQLVISLFYKSIANFINPKAQNLLGPTGYSWAVDNPFADEIITGVGRTLIGNVTTAFLF